LEEGVNQFLDYCTKHINARVRFVSSNMIIGMHSDASYPSESEVKIRAAEHFYLGKLNYESFSNVTTHMISKIINRAMSLTWEAEAAALFYNYQRAECWETSVTRGSQE